MSDLMKKMLGSAKSKFTAKLSESTVFNKEDNFISTDIPILDLALSGCMNGSGGVNDGVTVIAGESKRFKTLYALKMAESFHKKHKDGIILFYDSEFGANKKYINRYDIDVERVIHIPVTTVEELRNNMSAQLQVLYDEIEKDPGKKREKIFVLVDSIGNLASEKETKDAIEGNNKQDMTRAKANKSLFRIATPRINLLSIPAVFIAHTYKTQDLFPTDVVSGGTGSVYSADTVFIIGRQQEKDKNTNQILGYKFIINIYKSRYIKEKSKLSICVLYDKGILKYSGLSDIALDLEIIEKCRVGRKLGFRFTNKETGEFKEIEANEINENEEFWNYVFENSDFIRKTEEKYSTEAKKIEKLDQEES